MRTEEEWRAVPGYVGAYEVSSLGRVRSLDRRSLRGRLVRGRILSPIAAPGGYLKVNLRKYEVQSTHLVHRLVLLSFVGRPGAGLESRHLDGDPANNELTNLAWGTHLDNMRDRRRHGTHGNSVKTHCPQGHPYAGENLLVDKSGYRRCLTCRREDWRRLSARRSAERRVA